MMTFASITLSETDKRALIIFLILAVIVLLIVALIGFAVRKAITFQMKTLDTMMHDVTVTHVVENPKDFKRVGRIKNNRLLYKQSLIPFLIALVGLLIWIFTSLAKSNWGINPFEESRDLLFAYDMEEEGLFVTVFGIRLLSHWPNVAHTPEFVLEHLPSYLEAICFIVAAVYYLVICQAYFSRYIMILRRARSVYEKSLEGFNATQGTETPANPENK